MRNCGSAHHKSLHVFFVFGIFERLGQIENSLLLFGRIIEPEYDYFGIRAILLYIFEFLADDYRLIDERNIVRNNRSARTRLVAAAKLECAVFEQHEFAMLARRQNFAFVVTVFGDFCPLENVG